ncbi:MAG: response regulator [Acidimicrobiales bacterium]|jgi:two-component system chemotaxis response regulator CheY
MKALVVDDSRAMRSILSRLLRKAGVDHIAEAADGCEAIACLDDDDLPDIALVDWNMPNMNGLELVGALRGRPEWRRITILMVTTESEQGQIVRALAAGAHEYLIKPFEEESLFDKLAILGFHQPVQGDSTNDFAHN